jgi:hypothetical protein
LIRRFVDVLISEGETQLLFVSHHAEDAPPASPIAWSLSRTVSAIATFSAKSINLEGSALLFQITCTIHCYLFDLECSPS